MDEYISREEAIKDFERCNLVNPKWTPERVKQLLCRQPEEYVEPVRHGYWIDAVYYIETEVGLFPGRECSYCHEIMIVEFDNYCPNCGAKMNLNSSEKPNSWKN